jgi:hypothetical protein
MNLRAEPEVEAGPIGVGDGNHLVVDTVHDQRGMMDGPELSESLALGLQTNASPAAWLPGYADAPIYLDVMNPYVRALHLTEMSERSGRVIAPARRCKPLSQEEIHHVPQTDRDG